MVRVIGIGALPRRPASSPAERLIQRDVRGEAVGAGCQTMVSCVLTPLPFRGGAGGGARPQTLRSW